MPCGIAERGRTMVIIMDVSTIIGLCMAFGAMGGALAIMAGHGGGRVNLAGFIDPPAILLVIGGAVWLVVALTRRASTDARPPLSGTQVTGQTPLDIVKARYAKGEITKEQFDEMKRDLGG